MNSLQTGGHVANGILSHIASGIDVMETEIMDLHNTHTHTRTHKYMYIIQNRIRRGVIVRTTHISIQTINCF